jgi:acyl dehydratase
MAKLPPLDDCYFEDYRPGAVYEFGAEAVTESAIIEFAERYDPQTFHTDPEAAPDTPIGAFIASGWHTAALAMRMLVGHYISSVASIVSPGVDELRWHKPVRPGDVLSMRVEVIEARPSASKPDRGFLRSRFDVLNQHGEVVMSMVGLNLMRKRDAG